MRNSATDHLLLQQVANNLICASELMLVFLDVISKYRWIVLQKTTNRFASDIHVSFSNEITAARISGQIKLYVFRLNSSV